MTKKIEFQKDNTKIKLFINDDMPEMFVDGISQLTLGNTISKVTLHTVTNVINEPNIMSQERKGVLMLTMPTTALLEMCINILENGKSNIEKLTNAGKINDNLVNMILENVTINKRLD